MPTLSRRHFLQGLTAAGFAPALPALPVAAAPVPAAYTTMQYTWACYYAQMNNACSVSQITSALGVPVDVAQGLFDRLVTQNVLTAPGISGVSVSRKRQMMDMRGLRLKPVVAKVRFDPDQLMAEVTRDIDDQIPFVQKQSQVVIH